MANAVYFVTESRHHVKIPDHIIVSNPPNESFTSIFSFNTRGHILCKIFFKSLQKAYSHWSSWKVKYALMPFQRANVFLFLDSKGHLHHSFLLKWRPVHISASNLILRLWHNIWLKQNRNFVLF